MNWSFKITQNLKSNLKKKQEDKVCVQQKVCVLFCPKTRRILYERGPTSGYCNTSSMTL